MKRLGVGIVAGANQAKTTEWQAVMLRPQKPVLFWGARRRLEKSTIGGLIAGTRVVRPSPPRPTRQQQRRATTVNLAWGCAEPFFWVPGNGDNPASERRTRRRPRRSPGPVTWIGDPCAEVGWRRDDKKVRDDISQGAGNVSEGNCVINCIGRLKMLPTD